MTEPSRPTVQPTPPTAGAGRRHSLFDPPATNPLPHWPAWRIELNRVIYRADSSRGSLFDWSLLLLIAASVVVVLLESVAEFRASHGDALRAIEWGLTAAFTLEYLLRCVTAGRPWGYMTSFFGLVDLLSLLPTWLSLAFAGTQVLAVIRVLRLLRIFRLLQLSQFVDEAEALADALSASASRITVFLGTVLTIVVIMGAVMYLVEGQQSGFDSIPRSIYWAIVTLTTVGYGDIAPTTAAGQAIAAAVMVLGYAIIAVPTGMVTAEFIRSPNTRTRCPSCGHMVTCDSANFCCHCGASLREGES